jgi:hypothetical protein
MFSNALKLAREHVNVSFMSHLKDYLKDIYMKINMKESVVYLAEQHLHVQILAQRTFYHPTILHDTFKLRRFTNIRENFMCLFGDLYLIGKTYTFILSVNSVQDHSRFYFFLIFSGIRTLL